MLIRSKSGKYFTLVARRVYGVRDVKYLRATRKLAALVKSRSYTYVSIYLIPPSPFDPRQ